MYNLPLFMVAPLYIPGQQNLIGLLHFYVLWLLFSRKSATIEPASKNVSFLPTAGKEFAMAHTFSCSADAPLVRTTGGSVRGYRFDGLDIFKGIPYAKARRFHAPEPAVWDSVLDATSYGYVCPLLEMPKPNGEMLVPHRYWLMDEACQNLNIWTPALDDAHRPVLVWLHGGGYFAGSSIEQIAYEGENMARLGDCGGGFHQPPAEHPGLFRPFGFWGRNTPIPATRAGTISSPRCAGCGIILPRSAVTPAM